jgi:MFS transporter, SP family, general alpha glucoside:H+ symporter
MLLIAGPLLPESPSWLILHGKCEQAAKSLRRFTRFDVGNSIATIEVAIKQQYQILEEKSSYLDYFKGPNGSRTLIVCTVYVA